MSAIALLNEIRAAGIAVNVDGDRLHVEARPGTITPDLRNRMKAHKPTLLAVFRHRGQLLDLAMLEGIDLAHVHRLDDADLLAIPDDYTEINLRAYLCALVASADMDAGKVPASWRGAQAAICNGCGPVLLWAACPDVVKACPWCFRRKAGKRIPRPRVQVSNGVLNGFTDKGVTPAMREVLLAMRRRS